VRQAWTHLLFAEKDAAALDGKPFDIGQTSLILRDKSSIAHSAYDKMSSRGDNIVKEELGPKTLMTKLEGLWPSDSPHLSLGVLKEWFACFVYLPKLRDGAVLNETIAQGIQGTDPFFGYAEGVDAGSGDYRGLAFGRLPPAQLSDDGLIVRASVAREAEQRKKEEAGGSSTGGAETGEGGRASPDKPQEPGKRRQPTRFFGSVEIDTSRPIKAFEAIVNAVVAELQRTPGANLKLTLEISAEAEGGFPDTDIGVVRDNAKQLKFDPGSTGFEE